MDTPNPTNPKGLSTATLALIMDALDDRLWTLGGALGRPHKWMERNAESLLQTVRELDAFMADAGYPADEGASMFAHHDWWVVTHTPDDADVEYPDAGISPREVITYVERRASAVVAAATLRREIAERRQALSKLAEGG